MAKAQKQRPGLFSAQLKYWRSSRGYSQLDLATSANISARHVSFLETGRARPSEEMVLCLADTLAVPLREQNELLRAAGFAARWAEPNLHDGLQGPVARALERMLAQQEPYPLIVMNRRFDLVRTNAAADRLFRRFVVEPRALEPPINGYRLLFDPAGARPFIVDWERAALTMIARLHRDALTPPRDEGLRALLDELLAFPGVPRDWRQPDFSVPIEATFTLRLARGDLRLGFLSTLTVFSAPLNVTLEELRIESYFPLDEATERACRLLAGEAPRAQSA